MNTKELNDFLTNEVGYTKEQVREMSAFRKVKAWLEYEGILNYTIDIINVVEAAYQTKLPNR